MQLDYDVMIKTMQLDYDVMIKTLHRFIRFELLVSSKNQ